MNIVYFNIDDFPDIILEKIILTFPKVVSEGILRYKFLKDKKSRVIARLLVQIYYYKTYGEWDWDFWKVDRDSKKIFLKNGPFFNISHSEGLVIVAFNEFGRTGIDIEKTLEIDVIEISKDLHKDEKVLLENNRYNLNLFYSIWTRKEAVLKANGQGIIYGLDAFSVLNDRVFNEKLWHVQSIDIKNLYKCAICNEVKPDYIKITHIHFNEINNFIYEKIFN